MGGGGGRYKLALADVRHMLSMPREEVGESNIAVSEPASGG